MPRFNRNRFANLYVDNLYLDRQNRDIQMSRSAANILLLNDGLKLGGDLDLVQYEFLNAYPGLMALFRQGVTVPIPTQAVWRESNAGSGDFLHDTVFGQAQTGTTANSRGLGRAVIFGLAEGANYSDIDWDKAILLSVAVRRLNSDSEAVAYVKLAGENSHGDIGSRGIGFKIANYTLTGQAYGSALGETATLATLTDAAVLILHILHIPSDIKDFTKGVYFFNGNTQLASLTGASDVPTGKTSGVEHNLVVSIVNGATGGVNAVLNVGHLRILREA